MWCRAKGAIVVRVSRSGGFMLKASDEEEHGVGGVTLPDLNVQLPAEDPLVGETSSAASDRKRKSSQWDYESSDDSAQSYFSSEISFGDVVSYNSASSDASSNAEVTKYNVASYEKKIEEKIWEEGLDAYMNKNLMYYCKFHHNKKVPRDGSREGLVSHAKTVKPKDLRDKANHAALIKVNMDAQVAQVGAPRDVQKRVTIRDQGILGNADFNSFCVFSNLVEMDDEQLARVKRVVRKHKPSKPLYVFTIKKSNIIKGKAKMRTLELFNKECVMYKPADAAVSGNMEDEEDVNSFQNGPREKKEFMYKEESDSEGGGARVCSIVDMTLPDEGEEHDTHVKKPAENGTAQNANESMRTPAKVTGVNGRTPDKPFGDLGSTPDNPFIIDNVDPITSDSEIDIDAVSVSKFLSKAKKDAPNGCPPYETRKEDELVGKRKYTVPKKFQSPYALDRRTKRQVIDGYLGNLALRVGHDRFLCPPWRSKYLVDRAIAGDKPQESSKNIDSEMVRSNAVRRVLEEYTVREKIYFPLNIGNTHWMTIVMHMPKQEFQVLNSLYPLDLTLKTV
ncbi:hypothetical protein ACQ4PT_072221 [Festuca glaucescens]